MRLFLLAVFLLSVGCYSPPWFQPKTGILVEAFTEQSDNPYDHCDVYTTIVLKDEGLRVISFAGEYLHLFSDFMGERITLQYRETPDRPLCQGAEVDVTRLEDGE